MEEARSLFTELQEADSKVLKGWSLVVGGVEAIRRVSGNVSLAADGSDELIRRLTVVGSAKEGCNLPRMLKFKEAALEGDTMVVIAVLNAEQCQKVLVPMEGRQRSCKVKTKELKATLEAKIIEKYTKFTEERNIEDGEYLSGKTIKSLAEATVEYKDADNTLSVLCEKAFGDGHLYRMKHSIEFHGPATNLILELYKEDEMKLGVSIDFVIYIQMDYAPRELEVWMERSQNWPSEDDKKEAASLGCQLVPKPMKGESEDHEEWRISFTKIENYLACKYTMQQRMVYLMAKCIYYKHLNVAMGDEEFSSYCMKNTMLWMLEETLPADWAAVHPVHLVERLFTRLEGYLDKNHVPLFFIPSVNLIDEYSKDLLSIVTKKVKDIVADVLGHLPSEEEVRSLIQRGDDVVTIGKSSVPPIMQHFIEERIRKDMSRTVERCEESVDAIKNFFTNLGKPKPSYQDDGLD